jgi:4-amino-4-deoxy-L-arabinose transferase-like glycosyltransferase
MKNLPRENNSFLQSESRRDLVILLLLSAILKAILSLCIGVINPDDGVIYITAAQKLAGGAFKEALSIYGMPLYPLLIALTHYVIPNWIAAARVISIISSVLTIIPLYLLTKEIFYRQAALWACAAFALLPLSNHWSVGVLRDPLFLFFLAWSTYFANRAITSRKLIHFLLSSLTCLFSILCRLEGLILYIFYALYVFCLFLRRSQDRNGLLKGLSVYLAPPLLVFILFSLGTKWPPTFNRMDAVILKINEIINLKFVDRYIYIYNQLKNFEITTTKAKKWQNLIEIVRHYIPIIYLIGLLEKFFKALFPPYLIPLAVGVWKARNRNNIFIILFTACYLLSLYYYMFSTNSIRERYLLTPAFLLHPFIGVGLDRLYIYVRKSSRRRLFTILFVIFFALLPVYKSSRIIWDRDTVLLVAGEWLATIPQFQTAKIITTDRRIPFYAGRGIDPTLYRELNYFAMEKLALHKSFDLLIITTSKTSENSRPGLKKFMKVKEFAGTKDIVHIYCSPRLYRTIRDKGL